MTSSKQLNILAISDIHLGHRKTPSIHILENLRQYFLPKVRYADLILIAGDIFDRLLSLPAHEVDEIHRFIGDFLIETKKYNVSTRIVEGTPSHDWQQSQLFEQINRLNIHADIKWVRALDIEYIERFAFHILYIPDEWDSIENIYEQSLCAIADNNLTQVDFILMHGQFDFQIPNAQQVPKHDSDAYSKLARYFVVCGHVHRPSQHKNILIPGSFDRLAQGEEEDKGFVQIELDRENDQHRIHFIENEGAKTYRTIDLRGVDKQTCWEQLDEQLAFVEPNSYIAITLFKDDPLRDLADEVRKRYPLIYFDFKTEKAGQSSFEQIQNLKPEQLEPITPNSIRRLLSQKLEKMGIDPTTQSQIFERFDQIENA